MYNPEHVTSLVQGTAKSAPPLTSPLAPTYAGFWSNWRYSVHYSSDELCYVSKEQTNSDGL